MRLRDLNFLTGAFWSLESAAGLASLAGAGLALAAAFSGAALVVFLVVFLEAGLAAAFFVVFLAVFFEDLAGAFLVVFFVVFLAAFLAVFLVVFLAAFFEAAFLTTFFFEAAGLLEAVFGVFLDTFLVTFLEDFLVVFLATFLVVFLVFFLANVHRPLSQQILSHQCVGSNGCKGRRRGGNCQNRQVCLRTNSEQAVAGFILEMSQRYRVGRFRIRRACGSVGSGLRGVRLWIGCRVRRVGFRSSFGGGWRLIRGLCGLRLGVR